MLTLFDRVVCQVYIMEICPNKIRGGMITFQSVWYVQLPSDDSRRSN